MTAQNRTRDAQHSTKYVGMGITEKTAGRWQNGAICGIVAAQPTPEELERREQCQKAHQHRDYWNDRWMMAYATGLTQWQLSEARNEFYKWDSICLQYQEAAK